MKPLNMLLLVLALFGSRHANACNTNSGMYFDELNRQGSYDFRAFKNSTGAPYAKNMRVSWNFGDGNSGSGQTSHTYSNYGKYTITLYLWDSAASCGDTLYGSLCYFHPVLSPVVTRSNDTLFASATCNSSWTYRWIFDDGKFGSGCSVAHKYKNGFYKPILEWVKDTVMGCQDSVIHNFSVFDMTKCGIATDFGILGTTMNLNERIFTARPMGKYNTLSSKPGKVIWKWGDNTSTTTQYIPDYEYHAHLYQVMGYYRIQHIVIDSAGTCTDTARITFYIDSCTSDADFTYTVTGSSATFKARATAGDLKWTFGGGSGSSTTSFQPTATYSTNGSYNVCLENLFNDCTKKTCKSISINNCKLLGNYTHIIDSMDCLKVHFSQTTNKANLALKWDFGDSTISTNKNQTHTYGSKGVYQVKLWAIDTTGSCRDSATFSVLVILPQTRLTIAPIQPCFVLPSIQSAISSAVYLC